MVVYGVALLAGCYMAGNFIGDVLGALLGYYSTMRPIVKEKLIFGAEEQSHRHGASSF